MKLNIPETLRKTNPRWVKKLESRKNFSELSEECFIDGELLDMDDYTCCIVGEALHLFNFELKRPVILFYGCRICYRFANAFNTICMHGQGFDTQTYRTAFQNQLDSFAKHLEKAHPEILK